MHWNDHGTVGIVLTIQSVSPGAVDYLLRGSGCAEHEHAGEASARGGGRAADAVGYLLAGAANEPAGVWGGEGLAMLGVQAGTAATDALVRAVFGRLQHPSRLDAKTGEPLPLGSRPRNFQSRDERVAQALAAEPDATEERRAEIKQQVYAQTRKAVAYYDLTFSPAKSMSVYWTALLEDGRDAEAAKVVAAHRAGVAAAMAYVERETAFVRVGYHGKTTSGRSVGVYEQANGMVWVRWDHSTSRAQQPQLHSHITVLNRAKTASDGVIRALASRGFKPIKQAADAIYTKVYEETLAASTGVVFAARPDGKAREIVGFNSQLLAKASSRTADITARQNELVRQFEEAHGRAPSPVETRRIHRTAWRETRQAKNHAEAPRCQLSNWAAPVRDELGEALTAADAAGERVARDGHPERQGYEARDREQVLRAALRTVHDRYATWDIGNLAAAIREEQVRTPAVTGSPPDLAAEVLREGDRYGVVMLSVRDVGTVPVELRRRDGLSRYRMRNAEEYATTAQLRTEATIVERAHGTGAAALAGPAVERVRVELQAAGLGRDQQEAVLQILSSGRRGDVLIGPAGAGKSRTVGALAQAWEHHVDGRVLGVATSQAATQVLIEDGLTALNTRRFLHRFEPDEQGRVRDRLRPEDLVVVDEAGMTATGDVHRISAIVAAAGAKLLYTGDHEQLAAVGAGGMLELLVRDAGAVELTEIHRFTHAWERAASVRLRVGDPDVVSDYDVHGRIRGGTEQEMVAAAVRGYLADVLQGRRSLLVVRAEATARELSAQIRAELVAAGRVSAEVLGHTRDGNLIGVGDLLQARRNDHTLRVYGGRPVTNREVYEVVGRDRWTGTLTVRDRDGMLAHLPAAYVRAHTTLAYAVTAYGAQGQTVDTSHSLIDQCTTRSGVYVPGSRGRDANTFYVICQHAPDPHAPERIDSTPVAVLTDILTRPADATTAAEIARRAGVEETQSLAWVGTQWELLTAEYARHRATDTLTRLLPGDVHERLVDEPGYGRLMSAVRAMELAGHDPHAVLTEAVARGSLHDANSISDLLRYRIRLLDNGGRAPERAVRDGDWTTFATPWAGPVGDYARVLAAAATGRQTELGERAAANPPAWALAAATLGPPPANPLQRAEWVRRAGIVAAYRDLHAIPDTQLSIGAAPSRERAFHHALWRQALTALGHPADALDYATASDAELRRMRDAWRRAQAWAPQFVAEDLRVARELAEEYRRDAVIWRAGLDRHPDGSPDRELAERDVAAAEQLAAVSAARVEALERIQAVRTDWLARNREMQKRAAFAGDELERRRLDRDTAAPLGEQQELFTIADGESARNPDADIDSGATNARGVRGLDPAQHQLDLDSVPRAVPATPSTRREDTKHTTLKPTGSTVGGACEATVDDAQRRAAPATRGAATTPRAEPPGTTPDGYVELFAEATRAADREREQPVLFDAQPTPADVAAAQPLHVEDMSGGRSGAGVEYTEDESTADDSALTVSQSTRQAEIIAELRAELDARAAAAAPTPPRQRSADPDDGDIEVGAARRDIESRSEAVQGQGLSI
jgi:conjugative relaxase-like TrwC/TraI family protein